MKGRIEEGSGGRDGWRERGRRVASVDPHRARRH